MGRATFKFPPGMSQAEMNRIMKQAAAQKPAKTIAKKPAANKAKVAPKKAALASKAKAVPKKAAAVTKKQSPAKKAPPKAASAASAKKSSPKTAAKKRPDNPCNRYFDQLHAAAGSGGYFLIRGVHDEDDGSDEEEEVPRKSNDLLTEEEMTRMRVILGSEQRRKYQGWMRTLLLGEDRNSMLLCFDTSFSYTVEHVLETMLPALAKQKDLKKKFDMLFGLTMGLLEYDVWMHDHECEFLEAAGKLLPRLAKEWKSTLGKSDAAIGIDKEYTRPGVQALLEKFQRRVEDIDTCDEPEIKFKWR